jgi:hypothetical protein
MPILPRRSVLLLMVASLLILLAIVTEVVSLRWSDPKAFVLLVTVGSAALVTELLVYTRWLMANRRTSEGVAR